MTQHNSHTLVLPTPEVLSSVAGGAHYVGACSTHEKHVHPANVKKQARMLTMEAGDPLVEEIYRGVIHDLEEVRSCRSAVIYVQLMMSCLPQLFCGRATLDIFDRRWRPDAYFEDPWSMCTGLQDIMPRFFAIVRC